MQGHRRLALFPLASAGALLAALLATGPVHATATTITVTGFDDGPGTCPDSSHCSTLRAAVSAANGNNDGTIISLPAGTYTLSQPGDSTSLVIKAPMTIAGAGAGTTTVQGVCNSEQAWSGRLFTVDTDGPSNVAITGLTLSGGRVTDSDNGDGSSDGGAVLVKTEGRLALNHDVVTGNEAVGNGGGVAVDDSSATLATSDTIIKNNTAGSIATSCGPQENITALLNSSDGGGVYAEGTATMSSTSVASNVAGGNGGGLYLEPASGATDSLSLMFIHDNTAMANLEAIDIGGGGIYDELAPGTHVVLNQSTVSHNHATHGNGGGTYDDGSAPPTVAARTAITAPSVTVTNTTLNGNDAGLSGGASYLHGEVDATFTNDTVYGNHAANGGGVATGIAVLSHAAFESVTVDGNNATAGIAGGLSLLDGAATLHNSILALNSGIPQVAVVAAIESNCGLATHVLTSLGYNIADDTTCGLLATGDQQPPTAVAALGALQDNGGPTDGATGDTSPTLTQSPTTGSTALDAGDPVNFPPTDERGVARPQPAPAGLLGLGTPRAARVAGSPRVAGAGRADVGSLEVKVAPVTVPPTSTPVPSTGGVAGIIQVPSTGGGPDGGATALAVLAGSSLLVAAAGAVAARRRR